MANSYRLMTAEDVIPCSEADVDALCEQVNQDEEDGDCSSGMSFEFMSGEDGGLYISAEEGGFPEDLSEAVRKKIGEILKKAGKEYVELGYAEYCDKLRPGSSGGGAVRIYADGELRYARLVFE